MTEIRPLPVSDELVPPIIRTATFYHIAAVGNAVGWENRLGERKFRRRVGLRVPLVPLVLPPEYEEGSGFARITLEDVDSERGSVLRRQHPESIPPRSDDDFEQIGRLALGGVTKHNFDIKIFETHEVDRKSDITWAAVEALAVRLRSVEETL